MKKIKILFLILSCAACTKNSTSSDGTDCSSLTGVTFASNNGKMYALIASHCSGTNCHSAGGKEADEFIVTDNYTSIHALLSKAADEVTEKAMPPSGALTESEIQMWSCWKDAGFPQ
jgi:hypothetical protein